MSHGRCASPWPARRMRWFAICSAALAAFFLSPIHSWASPIIVFGDSLSDTGNAFHATGGSFPPAPYDSGRFSNGPTWVEQLASMLHAPTPTPSSQGGTDYAYAGAATGPTPISMQMGTPDNLSPLRTPSGQFIANVPSLSGQVASYIGSLNGKTPAAGTLATIWAGANDFFDGQQNPSAPAQNIVKAISTLLGAGVKNFLVLNLPDLSKTPFGLASSPAMQQGLHELTVGFNQALSADLRPMASKPGVHIQTLNTFGLFQQIQANPAQFHLSNVTGEGILSGKPSAPGYLFWDDVHPTTAGHRLVATQAATVLTGSPPVGPTAGAPEPSSLTLVATGLLGVFGYRWRRRNAA